MTDQDAFHELSERYRSALHLHCYRMLGSIHDAEDCVQETYLRAWTSFGQYAGRGSARNWLYQIATNTCLNALSRRARTRRILPEAAGPASHGFPAGSPASEILWLEPYPDRLLEGIADTAPAPHARTEMREAIGLAFVAAIQYLPARQRAALLLCDVLDWSAAETAALLDTSTPAINSALQRARATLAKRRPPTDHDASAAIGDDQSALLGRYMQAWEAKDIERFAGILRDDAVFSMPPWRQWYLGRESIQAFFAWAWTSEVYGEFHLTPTSANGQPAFAVHNRPQADGALWRPHSVQVLTIEDQTIAKITAFVAPAGPRLFSAFGLDEISQLFVVR